MHSRWRFRSNRARQCINWSQILRKIWCRWFVCNVLVPMVVKCPAGVQTNEAFTAADSFGEQQWSELTALRRSQWRLEERANRNFRQLFNCYTSFWALWPHKQSRSLTDVSRKEHCIQQTKEVFLFLWTRLKGLDILKSIFLQGLSLR